MADGVDFDKYDKRIIGSVSFFFSEKSKVQQIDPEELLKIGAAMKGALSATQDQIAWVLTLNLVATAAATPLTGWLASKFGWRRLITFRNAILLL